MEHSNKIEICSSGLMEICRVDGKRSFVDPRRVLSIEEIHGTERIVRIRVLGHSGPFDYESREDIETQVRRYDQSLAALRLLVGDRAMGAKEGDFHQ
ncbi:MAG: hypothetical protein WC824_11495 [Bacteroidota bacterium]|jgi:hypothetical protein